VEPTRKDVYIIALPVEEDKGLDSPITEHFGKTPLFLLVEISKEKIRSFTVEKNPFLDSEKHRGVAVAKFLVEKKVEIVLARKIGEGSYSVLKGNLIKIYKIPENIKTSQEAINLLREGKLERI